MLKLISILLLFLTFILANCQEASKNDANTDSNTLKDSASNEGKKDSKEKEKEKRPTDRRFNDIARLVAGMPAEEGTVMDIHHKNPSWVNYSNISNGQWQNVTEVKIPIMNKWRDEELKSTTEKGGILFYPFSGPDFLHASIFFPSVKEIVMIGLEPIGSMPDFDKMTKAGTFASYFGGLQHSLATILSYSFFRTLSMEVDLTGKVASDVDGTLHVLILFMARTNHKLLFYEKVAINPEGKIVLASEIKVEAGKKDNTYYGTRIDFQSPNDPERKILYYFGVNLSNDEYAGLGGLNQRKDLKNYLESLEISSTYLKSASYLMYKPYFSVIKDLILRKSKYVLQDDSGMAFNNFTDGKWDVTLFGRYVGPISLFANYWQQDMANAYTNAKDKVRPLPFGIGYQYAVGTSNLILATKK